MENKKAVKKGTSKSAEKEKRPARSASKGK
jgi:hypothetical protein